MSLRFNWKGILERDRGLTFDDVLLVPNKSDVRSRRDPDLSTRLTKNHIITVPIMSANMDTITEADMAIAMNQMGGFGILHRFMSIETQLEEIKKMKAAGLK